MNAYICLDQGYVVEVIANRLFKIWNNKGTTVRKFDFTSALSDGMITTDEITSMVKVISAMPKVKSVREYLLARHLDAEEITYGMSDKQYITTLCKEADLI